jgi:hypothetical protein
LVLLEVAIGDFPSQLEPSISRETRGGRSERVRIRGLAGSVTLCIRRRELPNREVPKEREGDRCRSVGLSTGSRHVASGFRRSGNGEVRVYVLRNPETRFPELTGTVDRWRDRWHQIPGIGVRHFGSFDTKRNCPTDSRSAKSRKGRGKVGPQDRVRARCLGVRPHHRKLTGGIGKSGFGVL